MASATTLCAAIGCAPAAAPLAPPAYSSPPSLCAYAGAPRTPPGPEYRYRVSASPAADELCVEVDLPAGKRPPQRWAPEGPLVPFVRDVAIELGGALAPVAIDQGTWPVPTCGDARGCRLRYRVLLADAARELDRFDLAEHHRGALIAPPSSWLLRPIGARAPFRAEVRAGNGFLTGLAPDAPGYVGDIGELDDTPYAVFGVRARPDLALAGGRIAIAFTPGALAPGAEAAIDRWIAQSARAVEAYYGRFPLARAALIVKLEEGTGPGSGHAMGNGGASILISAGEQSTYADLADDWILVHEMVHLCFPDVRLPWAEEGLATYVEPIIRARAGLVSPDVVWRDLAEGLPNGQPEDGDRGLDHTDTWGRRYWGGAMFWFLADLRIREQTGGRRSLDDALRRISEAGGNVSVRWDLDRALAIGDQATGAGVLRALRAELGEHPVRIDLDATWKRLGVSVRHGRVTYDDAAPLAAIRRAITARPARP